MAAITATLVSAGHNRLRYLLSSASTGTDTVTITTTGAATPDLLTDTGTNQGPIKKLAKAFTDGYGSFAAGALTQAQSRALWLSDSTGGTPVVAGNLLVPLARPRLEPISGSGLYGIDANVDGSGHPTLVVTSVGGGTAYLDIATPGAIGA
jgi:hypothetical protein